MDADAGRGLVVLNNSAEPVIHIWNITNRARPVELATVTAPGPVAGIGFQQNGRCLVTIDDAGSVRLWSLADPYHPGESHVLNPSGGATFVEDAPGRRMIALRADTDVQMFDVADVRNPAQTATIRSVAESVTTLGSRPIVVTASGHANAVGFRSLDKPSSPIGWLDLPIAPADLYASRDGRLLAVTAQGLDDQLLLWDVTEPAAVTSQDAVTLQGGSAPEFAPGQRTVATTASDPDYGPAVRLWDPDPDRVYQQVRASTESQ
ncbi:WD40 repeat protein [Kitasatospora sp. MAP12-15]|uniref:WD40 repeat domain-containing protein n=1 Tax=unclassified Kitasatospora TaxID=2633591 RepID=UPI0024771114|nr:WD40 repeat domain-containing protein [Kitasatospora sp. MAP12-44]MDH6113574.1 WD40 repeat protein [Kitasatospora sp. MAP12-44]